MAKKSKKHTRPDDGIVYSTSSGFSLGDLLKKQLGESPDDGPTRQDLRVNIERKGRAGKTVTLIKGFEGSEDEMQNLASDLKNHCGCGGSAKEGEIILQGDVREKAMRYLGDLGHRVK